MDTIKNMLLDLISMVKGFAYGFFLVGVLILIGTAFLYGFLFIRQLLLGWVG